MAWGPLAGVDMAWGPLAGVGAGGCGSGPAPEISRRGGGVVDGDFERPPGGAFGGGSGARAWGASFGGDIPASVDDAGGGLGFCPGPSPSDDDMGRIVLDRADQSVSRVRTRPAGPASTSITSPGR